MQQILFNQYLDPIELKKGKLKCPCCNRKLAAYGYILNKDLIKLAEMIYDHCKKHNSNYFKPKNIFLEELKSITSFPKLKCHNIIAKDKKTSMWKLTKIGKQFLEGKIKLPRKVWVFADKPILYDDTYKWIWEVEENWKKWSSDYINDYIIQPYKTELNLIK